GYSGTVHFTSSDGQAVLPGNATLTSGTGTFSAILRTTGNQTLTATDAATPTITGTSNAIKVLEQLLVTSLDSGGPSEVVVYDAVTFTRQLDFYPFGGLA